MVATLWPATASVSTFSFVYLTDAQILSLQAAHDRIYQTSPHQWFTTPFPLLSYFTCKSMATRYTQPSALASSWPRNTLIYLPMTSSAALASSTCNHPFCTLSLLRQSTLSNLSMFAQWASRPCHWHPGRHCTHHDWRPTASTCTGCTTHSGQAWLLQLCGDIEYRGGWN